MRQPSSSYILVTGAAGFVGSHVCDMLLKNGNKVVGLDNFDPYYPRAEKEENIRLANGNSDFTLIEGDIRDAELTAHIYSDYDIS
ncbi:GDP-mannose 4,6-dehydratase, partial [bacterium]|nr:GDP-mannose 4,6-dehydratase [bacterium]